MILPSPWLVAISIWNNALSGDLLYNAAATMARIAVGFVLAMALGMFIGLLMGIRSYWESFFGYIVYVGLTVPVLFWAVVGVMLFGFNFFTPVFTVFLAGTPYAALNIWQGTKAVSKDLTDMGKAFKVPRMKIIQEVFIPSLTPYIFSAARYSFLSTWKLIMIAEAFSATEGLGYRIYFSFLNGFSIRQVFAWTLVFAVVAFFLELVGFRRGERAVSRWKYV